MPGYLHLLSLVAPIFLVIGAGFFLRRQRLFGRETDDALTRVLVNFIYPAFILESILGNELVRDLGSVAIAPALGFAAILSGFALAYLAGPLVGLKLGKGRRTFAVTVGIFNFGYLPIPILSGLYGREILGPLFAFNLGVEIAIWTVGIMLLSGQREWGAMKRLLHPVLLAIVAGLLLNAAGIDRLLPQWGTTFLGLIGRMAIPLGLLLVGSAMAEVLQENRGKSPAWGVVGGACLLRLGLLPLFFVAAVQVVPLSVPLQQVVVVMAAMPSGVFPIVLARHFGGSPATAFTVVVSTTLVCLPVLPLWILWGSQLTAP